MLRLLLAETNWTIYLWLGATVLLFYFLILRPQKKREKADKALRSSIAPGDTIVTIGGFTGKVLQIKDDVVVFETGADRTKLTVKKWAIQAKETPVTELPDPPKGE